VAALLLTCLSACTPAQSGRPAPTGDPAARSLFVRALTRAVNQRRLTITAVTTSTYQGDLGGIVHGVTTNRIRPVKGQGISVEDRRTGGLPAPPIFIILAYHSLCLRLGSGGWGCAHAHRVSAGWYIRQYLLGGRVADLRFTVAPHSRTSPAITVHFAGRGMLGCTPAGAGAGTRQEYRWCRFRDLDRAQQHQPVSGRLVVDRATHLPRLFTARGVGPLSPVIETASFRYAGSFTVRLLAHARHLSCLSWVPAIHCVELHKP
jgi:hypothetical protein